ncbi:MAG: retropepsin-like aspartic protease [Acidobacteriota bacterium]
MSVIIEFLKVYEFDTRQTGITVPVKLFSDDKKVSLFAKIDTGSTHCFFERKYADQLGIVIESGQPLSVSTATGTFLAFGHELTLSVLDIEQCVWLYFIAEESIKRNVLGRQGFLSQVQFGLIDYEGKLLLSQYEEIVR